MITDPQLAVAARAYRSTIDGGGVPLRIICQLRPGARIGGYDPVNLDNLLARSVVDTVTAGAGLAPTAEAYDLPVPLRCLWRSDEGFPLWAATPFRPVGPSERDVAYWHKRAQLGEWTATKSGSFGISATKGRWMERRVPLPTIVAEAFAADAIGDPDAILALLEPLTFIGKRRTNGFGEVQSWSIEPLDHFALIVDGKTTRPLPADAVELLGDWRPIHPPSPVGWTPPQWKPSLFRIGWWTGAACEQVMTHTVALGR